jgi:hypothetical protein
MRRAREVSEKKSHAKEHKKETKLPYVACVARAKNIGICDSPCIVPARCALSPEQGEWRLLAGCSISLALAAVFLDETWPRFTLTRLEGATIFALFCCFFSACGSTKVS